VGWCFFYRAFCASYSPAHAPATMHFSGGDVGGSHRPAHEPIRLGPSIKVQGSSARVGAPIQPYPGCTAETPTAVTVAAGGAQVLAVAQALAVAAREESTL